MRLQAGDSNSRSRFRPFIGNQTEAGSSSISTETDRGGDSAEQTATPEARTEPSAEELDGQSVLTDDPQWYKDAVIYELHVRAFLDSDRDGIGDFQGLTTKLDYLQDLGVTALWVLPFYPSPLRDDGYDIADYGNVHPSYGDLRDFKRFLREAHRRGLRVITELVINHTSDQHPWFQRARRAPPGSAHRDFYVWSDTPERYRDARIIFKDFESSNWTWDPVAHAYYWHRFYSHQPDLNFENPRVIQALLKSLDFWMDMGVDGMRLDAIPYLFEREGTNCENLPETHDLLKQFRRHLDENYSNRLFLAEANQWPEDAAEYFGDGDECHMNFHFPLMPRLFMAVRMEDRFPIIDILEQTPEIPDNCQWAIFLRNHDELTLEMVTDEERDYMYRVYAHDREARINLGIRRRLAPLLQNNRRKIELMNGLLLSLPGTPVLYYGDEIGMGDNFYLGDRNGVRTPMQWSGDRNAGFSRANPQKLYLPVIIDPEYHYESVNVEAQQGNPSSLLWWMKRLLGLRKHYRALSRGDIEFLSSDNRKVIAYLRTYQDERILVIANLSRFAQAVELDMSEFRGMVPVELFGHTRFPPIGELPYFLTLGPHSFYWFSLEPQGAGEDQPVRLDSPEHVPVLAVRQSWTELLADRGLARLERILPGYLRGRRWYQGKARRIRSVRVEEILAPPGGEKADVRLLFVRVQYADASPDLYQIPVAFAGGEAAYALLHDRPEAVFARVRTKNGDPDAVLYDALSDGSFASELLELIRRRRRLRGVHGEAEGMPVQSWATKADSDADAEDLEPRLSRVEQSNTSVVYGDQLILKLYRRLDEGENLDLEVGRVLAEVEFSNTPAIAGALEYREGRERRVTLALLQEFIPNEGDAWRLTLDSLGEYFERVLATSGEAAPKESTTGPGRLLRLAEDEPDPEAQDLVGSYLELALLLGKRTGEMHLALGSAGERPDFAPEEFSTLYQRSLYQSMRTLVGQTFHTLEQNLERVPEEFRESASGVLASRRDLLGRLRRVVGPKLTGRRIRVHGDYHLGQVLYTGKDFYITDFEGEPLRPLSERRLKRSPLRDVAGMLRSLHYAAHSALREGVSGASLRDSDVEQLAPWVRFWYVRTAAAFLRGYSQALEGSSLIPSEPRELEILLNAYLLEKAIYELGYELNNRPSWIGIPLHGIDDLLAG